MGRRTLGGLRRRAAGDVTLADRHRSLLERRCVYQFFAMIAALLPRRRTPYPSSRTAFQSLFSNLSMGRTLASTKPFGPTRSQQYPEFEILFGIRRRGRSGRRRRGAVDA